MRVFSIAFCAAMTVAVSAHAGDPALCKKLMETVVEKNKIASATAASSIVSINSNSQLLSAIREQTAILEANANLMLATLAKCENDELYFDTNRYLDSAMSCQRELMTANTKTTKCDQNTWKPSK